MSDLQYTDIIDTANITDLTRKTQIESVLTQIGQTAEGQVLFSRIGQGTGMISVTDILGMGSQYDSNTATLNIDIGQLETTQVSFSQGGYDVISLNRTVTHEIFHAAEAYFNPDYASLAGLVTAGSGDSIAANRLRATIELDTVTFVNLFFDKNYSAEANRNSEFIFGSNGDPLYELKPFQDPKPVPFLSELNENPDYKAPFGTGDMLDILYDTEQTSWLDQIRDFFFGEQNQGSFDIFDQYDAIENSGLIDLSYLPNWIENIAQLDAGDIFYLDTTLSLQNLTGMEVNLLLGISGNAHWADNFIQLDSGTGYFIYEDSMVMRTTGDSVFYDYQVLNFGDLQYDSTLDLITTPAINDYLNFSTDFGAGITQQDRPESVVWQNGQAENGGNYSVDMDPEVLNGDGVANVAPASIVTDNQSPGRGTISESQTFFGQLFSGISDIFNGISDFVSGAVGGVLDAIGGILGAAASAVTGLFSGIASLLNIDPLVLDIDGDGVELVGFDDSVAVFDVDNDGFIENTGWVGGDDALLVHDVNNDGIINNITETISEYYLAAPGAGAIYEDGLEALATLDSNDDGVFDVNDAAYGMLHVWQDANEDAITDAGELRTLAEVGITSIDLNREIVTRTEIEGNPVLSRSTMIINGIEQMVAAVDFTTNPIGYEWNDVLEGVEIRTEDGQTASLIIDSIAGGTVDLSIINSDGDLDNDAGTVFGNIGDDIIIGDAGDNWLMGSAGSDTLIGGAGNDMLVIDADDDMANIDAGIGFDIVQVAGDRGVVVNLSDINAEVGIGGNGNDTFFGGGNTNVFVRGGAGDDVIIGGSADDALSGEDGEDFIDGGLGNDLIRGHRGADTLIGNSGEDFLDGGLGDDKIYGGVDDDLLMGGGGNDRLYGGDGHDQAEFSGYFSEYTFSTDAQGRFIVTDTVAGRDGVDVLVDVESLHFRDIIQVSIDNPAPFTSDDTISVSGSGAYTISAADILSNDIDLQSNILHITAILDVVGGSAVLDGVGDITFTPLANYNGIMGFKYQIADSDGNAGALVSTTASAQAEEVKGTVLLRVEGHPDDPLFYDQWYLNDANIIPVWNDYTGKGVDVGVFEVRGIMDINHADLVGNLDQNTLDSDAQIDGHATLVAGIIAAEKNDVGSVGVAYDSTLTGYHADASSGAGGITNVTSFSKHDIANNSWGWTDPFIDNFNEFPAGESLFGHAAALGRDGLGTVLVFASGNDRAEGGNSNTSNWNNNEYEITVGAINKVADLASLEIQQDPFSTPGANIHVSAAGSNVTSTSLLVENSNGSTFGGDYDEAEGTSFAAPLVSGVIALMLEANPDLGYRDVQEILAYTARKVDDANTTWQTNGATNWNGGGLHFSHDYGFGNVDALAAVRLAETWHKQETAHNVGRISYDGNIINQTIPDGGILSDSIVVDSLVPIEHVNLTIDFTHPQVGDLIVKLTSPDGTESILLDRLGKAPDDANDLGHGAEDMIFTFGSRAHIGEIATGTWTLEVTDANGSSVGTLRSWSLELVGEIDTTFVGTLPPPNTTYVYTNEYLNQTDPNREMLQDSIESAFEDDTLNVAAISGDVSVNLTDGTSSTLNGKILNIASGTSIERLFTGDGNDILLGNADHNLLWGGRGDDIINGGLGNDWIFGKSGINTLTGGAGADNFVLQKGDTGQQLIQDFSQGDGDRILIANYDSVIDISNLTLVQEGADTRITLPEGEEILIVDVLPSVFTNSDFIFDADFTHRLVRLEKSVGTVGDETISIGDNFEGHEIYGLEGNDTLVGGMGDDTIYGGAGDDILAGSSDSAFTTGGEDLLYGEEGNDTLYGSGQRDFLDGGAGEDVLYGNAGSDVIYLDGSGDLALGGEGAERYIVRRFTSGADGEDLIYDFDPASELIDLREFSEIRNLDDLVLELGQEDIGPNTEDVLRVWLTQGSVNQQLILKGFTDVNALEDSNFIFSADELPDAVRDQFAVDEDATLAFTTNDLLANDTDAEDGAPSFTKIVSGTVNGALTDDGLGNYTYTPHANYFGTDSFTYEVTDSSGGTATSSVFINVAAIGDAPTTSMSNTITQKTGTFLVFRPEFSDADGDLLTYTVTLQNGSPLPVWLTFDPDTLVLAGNTPLQPEDLALRFSATDGTNQTDQDITLSIATRPPAASDDTIITNEDTAVIIDVLANDTDPDLNILSVSAVGTAANGTLIINGDNTITYTPNTDYNGADSFSYTVSDGNGGTDTATVNLTVTPVNDNPTAVDDAFTGNQDLDVTGNVLTNDSDLDGDALNVIAGTYATTNGSVTLLANGDFTYTPNVGYTGTDSFNYTLDDGQGGSDVGTANLTLNAVATNTAPVAANDTISTDEDTSVTIDVLANDTDLDLDTLSVSSVGTAMNGTLVLNGDNTITYTPNTDYNGADSFTYTVSDGNGGTDTATVNLTVNPVNDAPILTNNGGSVPEGGTVVLNEEMLYVEDVDSSDVDLIFTVDTLPANGALKLSGVDIAVAGSFTFQDIVNGAVTFTQYDNNGSDGFNFTLSDGTNTLASDVFSIAVGPENDDPEAADDTVFTNEDTAVTIDVLANDTDPDLDTLSVSSVGTASNGTLVLNGDNTISYTPNTNYNGPDSFSYTVDDGNGGTDTATVNLTVNAVNDNPVAVDDNFVGDEDVVINGNVLTDNGNGIDSDLDGDTLSVIAENVTTAQGGLAVISANGDFTYTAVADFNGVDSFSYTVSDGNGGTDTATVNLTINAVDDAPVLTNNGGSVGEDDVLVLTAGMLEVVDVDTIASNRTYTLQSTPANGVLYLNGAALLIAAVFTQQDIIDGLVTYDSNPDFNGADSFDFIASDDTTALPVQTFALNVSAVNDNPVAVDDAITTDEDTAVVINVLANDTDLDLDTLSVSSVGTATNGMLVVNADNTITYTPNANYNGVDSFIYTVSDGNGGTDMATVNLTVNAVNDAPVLTNNGGTVGEDAILTLTSAMLNATDVDNVASELSFTVDILPTDGALKLNGIALTASQSFTLQNVIDGVVTFEPNANYNGMDGFNFTVSDGTATLVSESFAINVTPVNDNPVAVDDNFVGDEDVVINGNVLTDNDNGIDSDLDGDTLSVIAENVTTAQGGLAVISANGDFTYTAVADFNGADSFTYTVDDGNGGTDTATVNLTVSAVNDNPVAVDDAITTDEDTAVVINVLTNDTDLDLDTLSVSAVGTAGNGTLVLNGDNTITYTPTANYNGADSFSYTVSDGNGGTDTATVNLTVNAVNDNPVAVDDNFVGDEDVVINGNVLTDNGNGVDSDLDGDILTVTAEKVKTAQGGMAVISANGDFTYTPTANYNGADSFTYTVDDGNGGTDTATVNLTVSAVNDNPVAVDDVFTGVLGQDLIGNLLVDNGIGADADDGVLSVLSQSIMTAQGGTVTILANGDFIYASTANFIGFDQFDYTLLDSDGASDTGRVDLAITPFLYNEIKGTNGVDWIETGTINNVVWGFSGNDIVASSLGNDYISGGAGDDHIDGGDGDDTLLSGVGDDILMGGAGNDQLYGGAGNDIYQYTSGLDTISDTSGANDEISFHSVTALPYNFIDVSVQVLNGGQDLGIYLLGALVLTIEGQFVANQGIETLSFDDGTVFDLTSVLYDQHGSEESEAFLGLSGDATRDIIFAYGGNDIVHGGSGADILDGMGGDDILNGDDGNDVLYGGAGNDTLNGGAGNDILRGDGAYEGDGYYAPRSISPVNNNNGREPYIDPGVNNPSTEIPIGILYNTVVEETGGDNPDGPGDDGFYDTDDGLPPTEGTPGTDTPSGDSDADYTGPLIPPEDPVDTSGLDNGRDTGSGMSFDDVLTGGAGDDTLYGGDGVDTLYGDSGADTFVFEAASAFNDIDTIADFETTENDVIDIADLLSLYDPLNDTITDFVQITDSGANSIVSVDADGGSDNFIQIAQLNNVTGLTDEAALETSGSLITV